MFAVRPRDVTGTILVVGSLFAVAGVLAAPPTPEQKCQSARFRAAVKYNACSQKPFINPAISFGSGCRQRYAATWVRLQSSAELAGTSCDAPRWVDNGDGTVTDNLTGLQWEKKTNDATIHDVANPYTWSASGTLADGTAFTGFLAPLNAGACFAGQCDWRLPTLQELGTILLPEPYPCTTNPCIDAAFGAVPMGSERLNWSSTGYWIDPNLVFFMDFANGYVGFHTRVFPGGRSVRAVRGGL
jgi:hypothetical protein